MAYPHPSRYGYSHAHNDADIPSDAPQYFADPESTILEPALLNADMMHRPAPPQLRKGPYVNNNDIVSAGEPHHWNPQYAGGALSIDPASTGPTPYHDDHQPMPPLFDHTSQAQAWSFEPGSGDCTPTNRMDFDHPPAASGHFEHSHYMHQRNDSARGSFSHRIQRPTFNAPPEDNFLSQPVQTPMSPHSHQDWMMLAAQESESKPNRRRLKAQSPHMPTTDFQRRDGIRKKNARIDIPQERSIATIESLLESTTDEELLKELKQQKRLLRNREAALASRQRKKKHTEDLEAKEKEFSRSIESVLQRNEVLQHERDHLQHNYHQLCQQLGEFQRAHEILEQEKTELKRAHDKETAVLRKRIHILEENSQHGFAPAMSAAPSSTGFTDYNIAGMESLRMESLSMGSYDWEDILPASALQNDLFDDSLGFEPELEPSSLPAPIERPAASATTAPRPSAESTSEQSVTSGLLFFLLLCGAFVASKPPTSQPSDLPQVPADVRAAAPLVLSNLLNDIQPTTSVPATQIADSADPAPSTLSHPKTGLRSRSRLDRMHHRLTAPTRQQQLDSAFSLTTQEYASITNLDYAGSSSRLQDDHNTPSRPRRTIAEALQSAQDDSSRGKSDVDLRSLLMQQIPEGVVKQFRALVRDHEEIEARQKEEQQQRQHNDDMMGFKPEF